MKILLKNNQQHKLLVQSGNVLLSVESVSKKDWTPTEFLNNMLHI